ncbi:MAG TPA: extracellular solute-binding protein [Chthonomonadaceae bacterium]|nr:extracellular solute-binding protein [Chthonomonadaceae bacterium]
MQKLFGTIFLILILMSLWAWRLQPPPDGKLVWVSDDNPRRTEQIALFNKEQAAGLLNVPGIPPHPPTGLKLDPSNVGLEKVIVQSLGGVGPDIFDCGDYKSLSAYVRSGIALDITDALKARGVSLDSVWDCVKPFCVYNGRVYGWPSNAAVNALWLNQDMFEKEGIPLPAKRPWTWEEFIPLAQRLTKRDAAGHVTQYGFLADWFFLWPICLYQWGGHIYTPDGTRCIIDSPEAIAGIQFAHDLIYKYHIMPSPFEEAALSGQGGWGQGNIKWFGAGKGATAIGGRWWLCTLRDQTHPMQNGKPLPPTLRLRVVECPHGPLRVFQGYGRCALINATSPRAQEALDFIVFMTRKPYNDLINAQADANAAVKKYCDTPEFLHDPKYPEEQDNDVWRDIMKLGVPEEVSPFVDGQAVQRILDVQLDLVKSNQKSPADALHTAAQKINAEIQKMLAQDPVLRRQYEALTRKSSGK